MVNKGDLTSNELAIGALSILTSSSQVSTSYNQIKLNSYIDHSL